MRFYFQSRILNPRKLNFSHRSHLGKYRSTNTGSRTMSCVGNGQNDPLRCRILFGKCWKHAGVKTLHRGPHLNTSLPCVGFAYQRSYFHRHLHLLLHDVPPVVPATTPYPHSKTRKIPLAYHSLPSLSPCCVRTPNCRVARMAQSGWRQSLIGNWAKWLAEGQNPWL